MSSEIGRNSEKGNRNSYGAEAWVRGDVLREGKVSAFDKGEN